MVQLFVTVARNNMINFSRGIIFFISFLVTSCAVSQQCHEQLGETVFELEPTPLFVVANIPSQGTILELTLAYVYNERGEKVTPQSIDEAVCMMDLILDEKFKSVLRSALVEYLARSKSTLASPEVDLEGLWDAINENMDRVYAEYGLKKGTGLSLVFGELSAIFGLDYTGEVKNYGRLQLTSSEIGLSYPSDILYFILLKYLDEMRLENYSSKIFTKALIKEASAK